MPFGSTVGKACLSFIITNIDDAFVLVTFFAEATTSQSALTPLKITIGQYVGFTVIMVISLIGFAVAVALPSEPIGFLGLLPIVLGVWKFLGVVLPRDEDRGTADGGEGAAAAVESTRIASTKSIFKVAGITIMNGGDNIGTYTPLFSQAKGGEIAIYIVVYYILLGIWCLIAFLVMKQRHMLAMCEKYASYGIPFLYIGLGIYIVVQSDCFPWSIDKINNHFLANPGETVMAVSTAAMLAFLIGVMIWVRVHGRKTIATTGAEDVALDQATPVAAKTGEQPIGHNTSTTDIENSTPVVDDPVDSIKPNAERLDSENALCFMKGKDASSNHAKKAD